MENAKLNGSIGKLAEAFSEVIYEAMDVAETNMAAKIEGIG